jgi:Ulp1 family protease
VIVPVNLPGRHWVLYVLDVQARRVAAYDSGWRFTADGTRRRHLQTVMAAFSRLLADEEGEAHSPLWDCVEQDTAQQTDGTSCGVYAALNALALARGSIPSRQPGSERAMRALMAFQLITGRIEARRG